MTKQIERLINELRAVETVDQASANNLALAIRKVSQGAYWEGSHILTNHVEGANTGDEATIQGVAADLTNPQGYDGQKGIDILTTQIEVLQGPVQDELEFTKDGFHHVQNVVDHLTAFVDTLKTAQGPQSPTLAEVIKREFTTDETELATGWPLLDAELRTLIKVAALHNPIAKTIGERMDTLFPEQWLNDDAIMELVQNL